MQEPLALLWQGACQRLTAGDRVGAQALCEQLLAQAPGHPLAHWMLSSLLHDRGRVRDAANHAIRAAAHAGGLDADSQLRISWSLIVSGESQAATAILVALATRASPPAASRWELARQLALLDQHGLALACLDGLVAAGARAPMISHMRGNLLAFQGRQADAADAFEDAISQDPAFCLAHWSLVQLEQPGGHAGTLDRMHRLAAQRLSASDAARIFYALFKVHDGLGDTASAWQALSQGMQARRSEIAYDALEERAIHDRLIEALPVHGVGTTRPPHTDHADSPLPIFIVGMPRTGTTLLERILGNHPQVQVCGELNDLALQHEWLCNRPCPDTLDRAAAAGMGRLDADLLGSRYLRATRWRAAGRRWFTDKNPGNFIFSGVLGRALPDARIIHITRQPMDACFSNLKMLFAPGTYPYSYGLHDVAAHYRNYDRLMRHYEQLPGDQILRVDYESLVADPTDQARRILAHCRLPPVDDATDMTRSGATITTASRQQVRQPIHQRNVDGWRRYSGPLAELQDLLGEAGAP